MLKNEYFSPNPNPNLTLTLRSKPNDRKWLQNGTPDQYNEKLKVIILFKYYFHVHLVNIIAFILSAAALAFVNYCSTIWMLNYLIVNCNLHHNAGDVLLFKLWVAAGYRGSALYHTAIARVSYCFWNSTDVFIIFWNVLNFIAI